MIMNGPTTITTTSDVIAAAVAVTGPNLQAPDHLGKERPNQIILQ